MKITGIIAEYNPFHNGHEYHLQQTRERLRSDYIVVVMSGNYVQRGAPTIIDKYSRAEMALKAGVDIARNTMHTAAWRSWITAYRR